MSHLTEGWSKYNNTWYCERPNGEYVGGTFRVSNTSGGYHKLLKQWWDHYFRGKRVLLISESAKVKEEFQQEYPHWEIRTTDCHDKTTDIFVDMCAKINPFTEKFDLIINQATLEHVYNPFQAMENLVNSLNPGGFLITHTHPPACNYHQYPRDYFRFMKDWWYDLPKYIEGIELIEFFMHNNWDVFSLYQKV